MTNSVEIKIPICPTPKGRPRFTRQGRTYTPASTRLYETQLRMVLSGSYKGPILTGPLRIDLECYLPRPKKPAKPYPRGDVDNYAKAILDAANGVLWVDDTQIVALSVCKNYTVESFGYSFLTIMLAPSETK